MSGAPAVRRQLRTRTTSAAVPPRLPRWSGTTLAQGSDGPTRPVLLDPPRRRLSSGGSPLMTARTPVPPAYGGRSRGRESVGGEPGHDPVGGRLRGERVV